MLPLLLVLRVFLSSVPCVSSVNISLLSSRLPQLAHPFFGGASPSISPLSPRPAVLPEVPVFYSGIGASVEALISSLVARRLSTLPSALRPVAFFWNSLSSFVCRMDNGVVFAFLRACRWSSAVFLLDWASRSWIFPPGSVVLFFEISLVPLFSSIYSPFRGKFLPFSPSPLGPSLRAVAILFFGPVLFETISGSLRWSEVVYPALRQCLFAVDPFP